MNVVDLLKSFPHSRLIRSTDADACHADAELFPWCGYLSHRESEVLYGAAVAHPGAWCEIGSYVGWSAAVIASAGCRVTMVDLEYAAGATSGLLPRVIDNLTRAGLLERVTPAGMTADAFFAGCDRTFDGFLIDGNHETPCPLNDAMDAAARLKPGGCIVLHDTKGAPVVEAVEWLKSAGFTVTNHATINGIAVAVRV